MTRKEAQAFVDAIVALRTIATDGQALSAPAVYAAWRSGAAYEVGERLRYDGVLYKVLQAHTSQDGWEPDKAPSLFAKVLIPDETVIPAWEQPDSTNTYSKGDRVTHGGKTWESDIDNNSWEPGVYGWTEVVDG